MDFVIEPYETLFFRKPHPYHKGEPDYIQSVFPPTPRTLQGFLRTSILKAVYENFDAFHNGDKPSEFPDIHKMIGKSSDDLGQLQVKGPVLTINPSKLYKNLKEDIKVKKIPRWLKDKENDTNYITLYPKPRDILFKYEEDKLKAFTLELGNNIITDIANMKFPQSPKKYKDKIKDYKTSGWITSKLMDDYLKNGSLKSSRVEILPECLLWATEYKTGIAIDDKTGTSEMSQIYSIEPIRLRPGVFIGFNATIDNENGDGLLKEAIGMQKMGGEGRLVGLSLASDFGVKLPEFNESDVEIENGKFKLILLTPADFEGHWLPKSAQDREFDNGFPVECKCCGKEVKFTIVSACLDKPVGIGSRDISNHTTSIRQCVPAGGVYYCEGKVPSELHDCCIGGNYKMGFGHIVIGNWSD